MRYPADSASANVVLPNWAAVERSAAISESSLNDKTVMQAVCF